MILKQLYTLTLVLTFGLLKAQDYPTKDFVNPLEITPNTLAGNFGELRKNHFHAGLDLKTNQKEGQNIHAIADGYVSRIKISCTGYGNALYITHPNGYTSVYGHLQSFNSNIQTYLKTEQYKQQRFEVDVYPDSKDLLVKQNDLVALSGNSGGSGGPHLHFEIRDTKNEDVINPLAFGIVVDDTVKPVINGLYIYPLDGDVEGKTGRYTLPIKGSNYTKIISATNTIGVGVKAYDRQNGSDNSNGIYRINVFVNNDTIFTYTNNRFAFTETRAINSLIEYPSYTGQNSWIYQCFADSGNELRMLSNLKNYGKITLEDGKQYNIKVEVLDYNGNKTESNFIVQGKKPYAIEKPTGVNYFVWDKDNHYKDADIDLDFPKGTFYENFEFVYTKDFSNYNIHSNAIPLSNYYSIAITPQNIPTEKLAKAVVAIVYKKGGSTKTDYLDTQYKDGLLKTKAREFGVLKIVYDEAVPSIRPINVKENTTFSLAKPKIRFNISDVQTGIDTYNATVDGKWVLAVYDEKYKGLSIDLIDAGIAPGKHIFELNVTDEKNNMATYKVNINLQ